MVGREPLAHERPGSVRTGWPRVVTAAGVLAVSAAVVLAVVAGILLYTQVVVYLLRPGSVGSGEEDPVVRAHDNREFAVVMAVVGLALLALAAVGVLGGVNCLRGRPSGWWLTVGFGVAQLVLSCLGVLWIVNGLAAAARGPVQTTPSGPGLV